MERRSRMPSVLADISMNQIMRQKSMQAWESLEVLPGHMALGPVSSNSGTEIDLSPLIPLEPKRPTVLTRLFFVLECVLGSVEQEAARIVGQEPKNSGRN